MEKTNIENNIVTPPVKKPRKPRKKANSVVVKELPPTVPPVTEPEKEDIVFAVKEEVPDVEEKNTEVAIPEKVEESIANSNVSDFKSLLIKKITELAPGSFIKSGALGLWVKVLKNGGTLAVTQQGKVVFLNQIAPDKGGKDILNKKYRIKEFITNIQ